MSFKNWAWIIKHWGWSFNNQVSTIRFKELSVKSQFHESCSTAYGPSAASRKSSLHIYKGKPLAFPFVEALVVFIIYQDYGSRDFLNRWYSHFRHTNKRKNFLVRFLYSHQLVWVRCIKQYFYLHTLQASIPAECAGTVDWFTNKNDFCSSFLP